MKVDLVDIKKRFESEANHATLLEGRSADERLENEILEEDLGGTSHNRTAEADQQDPYVMGYFLTMPGKEPRWVDLSGDSLTQQLNQDPNLSPFTSTADLVKDLTCQLGVEVTTAPAGSFPEMVAPFPSNNIAEAECTNDEVCPYYRTDANETKWGVSKETTLTIENETKQHNQKKEMRKELNHIGEKSTSATTQVNDVEINLLRPNSIEYKSLTNSMQKPTSAEMGKNAENNEVSESKQDIRETQDKQINEDAMNSENERECSNIVIEFKQF